MDSKITEDQLIVARYPLLYEDRDASIQESLIPFGLEIRPGWFPLVDSLSCALEKEIRIYKEEYPDANCARCHCPKKDHYGCLSWTPGKCLAVKKVGKYHSWKYRHFKFKPAFLATLLTTIFYFARRVKNKILDTLFYKYETCYCEKYRHPHPRASQVKEKFGTLRFYMTHTTDKMDKLIGEAEKLSEVTCENCGEPGTLRQDGWWRTLCDKCEEKK